MPLLRFMGRRPTTEQAVLARLFSGLRNRRGVCPRAERTKFTRLQHCRKHTWGDARGLSKLCLRGCPAAYEQAKAYVFVEDENEFEKQVQKMAAIVQLESCFIKIMPALLNIGAQAFYVSCKDEVLFSNYNFIYQSFIIVGKCKGIVILRGAFFESYFHRLGVIAFFH